jgi:hypothetical protein
MSTNDFAAKLWIKESPRRGLALLYRNTVVRVKPNVVDAVSNLLRFEVPEQGVPRSVLDGSYDRDVPLVVATTPRARPTMMLSHFIQHSSH